MEHITPNKSILVQYQYNTKVFCFFYSIALLQMCKLLNINPHSTLQSWLNGFGCVSDDL